MASSKLTTETQSSTQLDVKSTPSLPQPSSTISTSTTTSVEESAIDNLVVSAGRNSSTSMTGSNSEPIIVGLVAPLFVISCGVIVVVATGMFVFQYRKKRRQHNTGNVLYSNKLTVFTTSILTFHF